jgi:hypothetical protein
MFSSSPVMRRFCALYRHVLRLFYIESLDSEAFESDAQSDSEYALGQRTPEGVGRQ